MSKSIAIFGGSFNPPHEGHLEMAKRLVRRKTIDEVWILPVYRHPFGKQLAPFGERYSLSRSFFRNLGSKIKVKDLERRLGGKSWTIRLIKHLQKKYPSYKLSLVLGGDTYRERNHWKDFAEIKKRVSFIVFPRGPQSPIPNISSTEIRNRLLKAKKQIG